MAYAALISLSQTPEHILNYQSSLLHPEEQQIRSLHKKLGFLLSFLDDSLPKSREVITRLEGRIRDTTSEAQDVIELHMSKQISSESACHGIFSCFWELIDALYPSENSMVFRVGLEKVLKELNFILDELEKIKKDTNSIRLSRPSIQADLSTQSSSHIKTEIEHLLPNESTLVGLNDDLQKIKEWLLSEQSSSRLIIPIVGMGGIGKSTLARNVYNDSYVVQRFDIHAWITVSQNYNPSELLTRLLSSMLGQGHELNGMEITDLKEKLYKTLKGKRYFIVMDDVWDTKSWDELKILFPNDNNGSRIILTTRQSDVASYVTNPCSLIHHMHFLSPKDSWDLLRQKALREECYPLELEEIGMVIAEKCKGLALALVVVGGILYKGERTQEYWQYVAENVASTINRNYEDFMEILSWSYNHLPYHLRACFLYMGVFPEDYEIHVPILICLWVAEGFLKPVAGNSSEEVAMKYLKELIDRNLIMVKSRSFDGEIKSCNIHDLMRNICMMKAQEEKFFYIVNHDKDKISPKILNNYRRLSILNNKHYDFSNLTGSTLQSFLYFGVGLSSIYLRSQQLRVLDACHINFCEFPVRIVELINLTYISLVCQNEATIPASISELQNLETLIVFRDQINFDKPSSLTSEYLGDAAFKASHV